MQSNQNRMKLILLGLTDKVVVNTDVWTDVTIGTVTTDIVTADDLNDMKENSSSSKKSSKGSNQ